ncbi:flippase [Priestia megaterium]|uniref:oligosaccharide flippase family protein n=1 Tax=Priestia megaterium TaxID=1404 RepID=UPI000BF95661|nr:oligosaccharide flippase family protein [Priestia megaterium]PFO15349.1 flippase [Priestia megaterium]
MLKKNILYNFSYQFLIMFLPFITAPYLTRVIGAEGIGVYSYSFSLASYFIYFSMLGLSNYGNRTIASIRTDKVQLSKTFSEIYCMQIMTSFLSIVAYIVYIIFLAENKVVAICQLILVCSAILDINWFFFGLEKFKLTIFRNVFVKLATVLCIFFFVKTQADVYKYILIMAIGTFVSQAVLWPYVTKEINFLIPKLANIFKHFKQNFMLFIPVISVSIYKIMDKIMLGQISGMESVGYFESAERIINVPVALFTAVGVVMLPKISSYIAMGKKNDTQRYFDLSMLLILAFTNAAAFGIAGIADEFVYVFYGSNFSMTATIMKLLAVTIIFLAAGNVLRTQFLIPMKKDSIYIKSAILGAVVNFTINILLIPKLHVIGASLGTIMAEFVVCMYQFFAVRKDIKFKKYLLWELIFLVAGSIMFIVIKELPLINNVYVDLILQIIAGGLVYCIIAYFCIIRRIVGDIIKTRKNFNQEVSK